MKLGKSEHLRSGTHGLTGRAKQTKIHGVTRQKETGGNYQTINKERK